MSHQLTDAQWKRISSDYAAMYTALRRIESYMPPEKLRRQAEKKYGLEPDEAVEMAYENVISEARIGLRGAKKPFVPKEDNGG